MRAPVRFALLGPTGPRIGQRTGNVDNVENGRAAGEAGVHRLPRRSSEPERDGGLGPLVARRTGKRCGCNLRLGHPHGDDPAPQRLTKYIAKKIGMLIAGRPFSMARPMNTATTSPTSWNDDVVGDQFHGSLHSEAPAGRLAVRFNRPRRPDVCCRDGGAGDGNQRPNAAEGPVRPGLWEDPSVGARAEKHRPDRVSLHEQGAVFHAHSRRSAGSRRDP